RVRMEPVQARAVLHLEAHALALAGRNRVEPRAVLGLRKRQSVEVHRGGLGQCIFDQRVEALATSREQDRLGDLAGAEVGDVSAAPGDRVDAQYAETFYVRERDARRFGPGFRLLQAAR